MSSITSQYGTTASVNKAFRTELITPTVPHITQTSSPTIKSNFAHEQMVTEYNIQVIFRYFRTSQPLRDQRPNSHSYGLTAFNIRFNFCSSDPHTSLLMLISKTHPRFLTFVIKLKPNFMTQWLTPMLRIRESWV